MTLIEQIWVYLAGFVAVFLVTFTGVAVGMPAAIRVVKDRNAGRAPSRRDERIWTIGSGVAIYGSLVAVAVAAPVVRAVTDTPPWVMLGFILLTVAGWVVFLLSLSGGES